MNAVLDASAMLAYLQDEPGSEAVEVVLAESVISSVNWAEVVQKSIAAGVTVDGMRVDLEALGLEIYPFAPEDAEVTGRLWQQTRQYGLSLGDRACLSLGLKFGIPVLTTDRAWANLGLTLDVRVIR
ncbi:type II toxin-antitoxin system VapC family toxin [Nostoc sp. CHAB 5784]|uniref:PIN domain-containing protein n=1 Tax=Nostoc mirabile TaxID=2907820 RepID=UPI001E5D8DDD|nr:type II toxin-antitoxin system VapC family toxin [Nostoc mirabile]MCC5667216.1 type II toxin-antitoxin system VapC family toxin [Nostoc mirabile CHAB5784]